MNLTVAYRGRSSVIRRPDSLALSLAPNLRRDRVSFDGVLRQPLRFREAVSALHDVVISDLRFQPRTSRPTRRTSRSSRSARK